MKYKKHQFLYQFDKLGKLTRTHLNIKEAAIALNLNDSAIRSAIDKGCLVNYVYHFSFDKNFTIPIKERRKWTPVYNSGRIFGQKMGYRVFGSDRCFSEKTKFAGKW